MGEDELKTRGGLKAPPPPSIDGNHSKVIRREPGKFDWKDVPLEPYKNDTAEYKGISRRELVGKRGESMNFHVRYFEIAPGGFSTLEKHEHEHVVIPMRGKGEAQAGCYIWTVGVGDVVYVSPSDPHQFRCPADAKEPFGFLCMVNSERDKPASVDGLGVCHICE
ncbi:MAG: cupin domain-containing protein [Elusimicrobiota bacterium]|nr:cupin domain-containing protein [Elusimicrobiota bacterium]